MATSGKKALIVTLLPVGDGRSTENVFSRKNAILQKTEILWLSPSVIINCRDKYMY